MIFTLNNKTNITSENYTVFNINVAHIVSLSQIIKMNKYLYFEIDLSNGKTIVIRVSTSQIDDNICDELISEKHTIDNFTTRYNDFKYSLGKALNITSSYMNDFKSFIFEPYKALAGLKNSDMDIDKTKNSINLIKKATEQQ